MNDFGNFLSDKKHILNSGILGAIQTFLYWITFLAKRVNFMSGMNGFVDLNLPAGSS